MSKGTRSAVTPKTPTGDDDGRALLSLPSFVLLLVSVGTGVLVGMLLGRDCVRGGGAVADRAQLTGEVIG